jgi:hypothetical protein
MDLVRAGDDYFMVMEYVRGGDLRTLFKRAKRRRRRFLPAASIYVAREVLSALAYAHHKGGLDGRPLGLIHRDVSPSNVLISGNGEVKLTDFGIAKATTHRSVFYRVKGKVGYMSPEQARGEPLHPRSDLYSVGVSLFEMLTGERLHVPQSITTSADEIYAIPIPAVSQKVPGLPAELDAIVWKSLAVEPELRYQTAVEFQEALLAVANQHRLAFSPPELARHLVDACGPVAEWRSTVINESVPSGTEVVDEEHRPRALTDPDLEAFLAASEAERDAMEDDLVWVNQLGEDTIGPQTLARTRPETTRDTQRLGAVDTTSVLSEMIAAPQVVKRRRWPRRAAAFAALAAAGVAAVMVVRANAPPPATPRPVAPPPPRPPPPVKLVVESEPPGARVLIDGQQRCLAPCTLERPGGHIARLRLEKDGYLPWTALVMGLEAVPQKAKLRPKPPASWGAIHLTTSIAANVSVGGKPIGFATGPNGNNDEPLPLPPGDVTLDLIPPGGGKPISVQVTVKSGATAEVAVTSP